MQNTTQDRPSSYAIYRDTAIAKLAACAATTARFINAVAAVSFRFCRKRQITAHLFFTLLALPKHHVNNSEDVAMAILPFWSIQGFRVIYKRSSWIL